MDTIKTLPKGMHEYSNSYLHLIMDEEAHLLYSEWVRKPSSLEYRESIGIIARYIREGDIYYWLQDTERLGEVTPEDFKVVLQETVPLIASSSLKKLARITPDDTNLAAFMQLASSLQVQLNSDIQIQQFKTYREAADWLSE
ncbi:hypothetical protein [Pontibacter roseus]|uniref:hypothetical protein n=1 Tax=Pontibacter roseus TaxID=336989 RepID=UPI00035D1051|nr:hypothetical protein [Pontibacter roseus]